MSPRYGAIETGGTKIICAIGDASGVLAEDRIPTGTDPRAALQAAAAFFLGHGGVDALGIGSFGPCDPNPRSARYGWVTATPKPGWADTDVIGLLREAGLDVPTAFDTDVNAAAYGEWQAAGARPEESLLYVTVGTGIGGGFIEDGRPRYGSAHPEMGHQLIRNAPDDGVCPFHRNCWEGVAAGPAIAARAGRPGPQIPAEDPEWSVVGELVATGLANLALVLMPATIVLGGGVGSLPHLQSRVSDRLPALLAGYVPAPGLRPPVLGGRSAVHGCFAMAAGALAD